MSVPLNINGAVFNYPTNFGVNWAIDATGWAQAVTSGMLQKAGGSFPLTADVDFGGSFGLKSAYFETRLTPSATAGLIRLAKTDNIEWRNNANTGNNVLAVDNTDNLTYNGLALGFTGTVNPGTAGQIAYYATSSNVISGAPFLTYTAPNLISQANLVLETSGLSNTILTDSSGNLFLKDVDNSRTILEYVRAIPQNNMTIPLSMGSNNIINLANGVNPQDAVTFSQLGTKLSLSGGTMTGDINMGSHSVTSMANAVNPGDAVPFGQLNSLLAVKQIVFFTTMTPKVTISGTFVDTNLIGSITIGSGNRVAILAWGCGSIATGTATAFFTLARNGFGNLLGTSGGQEITFSNAITMPVSLGYIDSPGSSGTFTYDVQIRNGDGTTTIKFGDTNLMQVMILAEVL